MNMQQVCDHTVIINYVMKSPQLDVIKICSLAIVRLHIPKVRWLFLIYYMTIFFNSYNFPAIKT